MKLNYHEVSDGVVLDYDAAGNLVGIDIDNARPHTEKVPRADIRSCRRGEARPIHAGLTDLSLPVTVVQSCLSGS
ncbi:MAG TPA: DUF2283 domain-containing protein, partial [Anaerolineales bacterium]